ncbi:MAG: hypothetical protein LBD11_06785 [Candidatus Peribacteria bacterium]|jgi:outer membrane biosynthesis protein TonB|nr:hypothetical protein [Candidatus Peribacteria bacterium]
MTKNLFLLFSIYFFVAQAIIVGLLTGNVLFYQIGAINAGAILVISILYATFTTPDQPKEKKPIPAPIIKEEPVKAKPETPAPTYRNEEKEKIKEEKAPYKEPVAEKTTHQVQVVQPTPSSSKKRKKT